MDRRFVIASSLSVVGAAALGRVAHAQTPAGAGFTFLPAPGAPFSGGAATQPGFGLTRVRLRVPLPLEQGLTFAARFITSAGRPAAALAGVELRSPERLSRVDFAAFNKRYADALDAAGFTTGDLHSAARSNMAPEYDPPATAVLVAFTFAAPVPDRGSQRRPDFVISGRPENDSSPAGMVAAGDVSPAAMAQKARFVYGELRKSVAALGGTWSDITGVQLYMRQPVETVIEALRVNELLDVGPALFPGSPPVAGPGTANYEFESDVRSVGLERTV